MDDLRSRNNAEAARGLAAYGRGFFLKPTTKTGCPWHVETDEELTLFLAEASPNIQWRAQPGKMGW